MDSNNKAHAAPAVISEERLRALAAGWLAGTENRERGNGYIRGVDFALVKCAEDILTLIGDSPKGGSDARDAARITQLEAEVEALRNGIDRAISEIDDDGPKALKYARQELVAAMQAASAEVKT